MTANSLRYPPGKAFATRRAAASRSAAAAFSLRPVFNRPNDQKNGPRSQTFCPDAAFTKVTGIHGEQSPNRKRGGITATSVLGSPFNVSGFPRIAGSLWNSRVHIE